jgi:hypothetical protein
MDFPKKCNAFIIWNKEAVVYYIVTFDMRYSTSDTDPVYKMREHLSTAIGIVSRVTPPSTNMAQRCSTLVIKCLPVGLTWQEAVCSAAYSSH